MTKNVLSLNSVDAKKFFLSHEAYSNMELPPYFTFGKMLSDIEKEFAKNELDFDDIKKAKKSELVNHILYGNKDGKYAWRKYQVINPLIYLSLVNVITSKNNWKNIQNRFKEFQKDIKIECESIPILPSNKNKQKASQISQWVTNVEKKSVILSLKYQFLYQTDVINCYGSIYTHSLPWAIHTKIISKNKRGFDDLFGNKIDHHIQAMSYGQTNGIPQGSVLMDFIAELVLGYADSELSKKLKTNLNDKNFHILRYRDDYRIFVNDTSNGDVILKCLSEVLSDLGFQLNTHKTFFADDVVSGSIKPDKFSALKFEALPKKLSKKELLRQLLIIQKIGKEYPNCGTLNKRLSKILDVVKEKDFRYQEEVVVSLLINIAYNNPNTFPLVAGLISHCISKLSKNKQKELIVNIQKKIQALANAGLLEIWIQRMSLGLNFKLKLNEKLCKSVYNETLKIFETKWIKDKKIKNIIDSNVYINKNKIDKIKPIISNKEVQIFAPY